MQQSFNRITHHKSSRTHYGTGPLTICNFNVVHLYISAFCVKYPTALDETNVLSLNFPPRKNSINYISFGSSFVVQVLISHTAERDNCTYFLRRQVMIMQFENPDWASKINFGVPSILLWKFQAEKIATTFDWWCAT